ncbi:MAG: glycosyl hydrolase [Bacteroidia bacterium]|jgi:hypothetical protein|nr:glycosyl hydrolase [Bacteroidia bacterium]
MHILQQSYICTNIKILVAVLSLFWIQSCDEFTSGTPVIEASEYYTSAKPCTRWWWFATAIKKTDIKHQLDWAKENNFGGVEIAWVYPLYRYQKMYARAYGRSYPKDSSAQKWLSKKWTATAVYAKRYADTIGLSCDFTFGSAWPVAGPQISKKNRTQIYGDSSFQQLLTFSWAWPDTMYVIDHLNSAAFEEFATPVGDALKPALEGSKSALFTDSWEIKLNATNKIWTQGFGDTFYKRFGYDIVPFMNKGIDSFPHVRYDYMTHLDEYVTTGFYKPYVAKCKKLGAWSRVQCLAAPTDVMTTYSLVDIPETESMLNNPNYSRIVSSSACLASKRLVSSETFTCMYGFPSTYLHQEQTADLKMVADAMFAHGVNHHVYHGMPYNPKGSDTNTFFATTYFGPGGNLTPELPEFNAYMEKVSRYMQIGRTYSDVAVYIPHEDGIMKGAYPPERQRVWVWGEYELRYIDPPAELEGHHPLWINRHFLEKATWDNGRLTVGDASFSTLYIDVDYMDIRSLTRIVHLAQQGLPVCIKNSPEQPGKVKNSTYTSLLSRLMLLPSVSQTFEKTTKTLPLLQADSLPQYWCKVDNAGNAYVFLAQWKAKNLVYPVYAGQSYMKSNNHLQLTINYNGKQSEVDVLFRPYQSVLLKISPDGKTTFLDIEYTPKNPEVKPREKQRTYF